MAEPARRRVSRREGPPVDPMAVPRAYRLERRKRRAREQWRREQKLASLRFWLVLVLLTSALLLLSLTVWNEIERLFGL